MPEALKAYNQGTAELRSGAFYKASKSFQEAIRIDPKFALPHARLAEVYTELDYSDLAKDELINANRLEPDRSLYPKEDNLYLNAVSATLGRDFGGATDSYKQLVELQKRSPEAYVDLGRAYEKADDSTKAIESYTEATNYGPDYAAAFLRLGSLQGRSANLPAAESSFSKAEELYNRQLNVEGRTEVFYQRGQLYNQLNKLTEARQQLQLALEGARATTNQYQQIRALLQLASVTMTEGHVEEARAQVNQAISLAQANGMETLIASGLNDLGNIYFVKGAYEEAAKSFEEALDYARRSKIRRSEARALLSLASLSSSRFSDPDKTITYAQQALPFFQQGNYKKETTQALLLIGRANSLKGNYTDALQAFEQLLQSAEKSGDTSSIALAHGEIGICLVQQEQYPKAVEHFKTNYEINNSQNNAAGRGFGLANHGNALWQMGRFEEARADFKEATIIAEQPQGKFRGLLSWLFLTQSRMAIAE